jgi:diguanylate cyclase (GGDEF)-like protein
MSEAKQHIVYVEDDAVLAKLVRKRLEDEGYAVSLAGDGVEGAERILGGGCDLALIDYQLPGMTGLDILRRLAAAGLRTPVIMVSGAGELEVAVEALKLGAADYVPKGVDGSYLDLLAPTLRRVLDRHRLRILKEQAEAEVRRQTDLLRTTMTNIDQGVVFFDGDLRLVVCNDRYRALLDLPPDLIRPSSRFASIVEHCAARGDYGPDDPEGAAAARIERAGQAVPHRYERRCGDRILEVRGAPVAGAEGGFIATYTDITERKAAEEELHRHATVDGLTGARNRRHFLEVAGSEVQRAQRHGSPLALVMLDIDFFKAVNDTHGHQAGDTVLRAVADVVTAGLRVHDVLGRLGGEEFALLLPETDVDGASILAERLCRRVAATRIPLEDGAMVSVTFSAGLSGLGGLVTSLDDLLRVADEYLYEAKRAGRNCVCG